MKNPCFTTPQIVRCKDCEYWHVHIDDVTGREKHHCTHQYGCVTESDGSSFCSWAKKKHSKKAVIFNAE